MTFLRGDEAVKVREEVGSIMAVELEEAVSLRQLRQWQRAWRVMVLVFGR